MPPYYWLTTSVFWDSVLCCGQKCFSKIASCTVAEVMLKADWSVTVQCFQCKAVSCDCKFAGQSSPSLNFWMQRNMKTFRTILRFRFEAFACILMNVNGTKSAVWPPLVAKLCRILNLLWQYVIFESECQFECNLAFLECPFGSSHKTVCFQNISKLSADVVWTTFTVLFLESCGKELSEYSLKNSHLSFKKQH